MNSSFAKKIRLYFSIGCLLLFSAVLISCGSVGSIRNSGKIANGMYSNSSIGFSISRPDSNWTMTMNITDSDSANGIDTGLVLIINYHDSSSGFHPNVIVTASHKIGNDSIAGVTQTAINQFFSDTTLHNKDISYNAQETINGSTFGHVKANFSKQVIVHDNLATLVFQVEQFVTIHNGFIIVFTFLDTVDDIPENVSAFYAIQQSIHLQ